MGQEVAANIINDVAIEVGLIPAPINDPFASIDPNILQLAKLLKSGGRTLRKRYSWTHLQYQYTFNTIANQGRYVLPVDYGKYINQTAWNRTNRLPLGGPLSPQEFEYFKARLVGVVFTTLFRILQQQFQVYPDTSTPGGYTIAFEYVSSFWVVPSATQVTSGSWQNATTYPNGTFIRNGGNIYQATQAGSGVSGGFGPTGTGAGITDGTCVWSFISVGGADAPASSQDLVQFDSHLMTRKLKLDWMMAKNFDWSAAENDYEMALKDVIADDSAADVLKLDRSAWDYPMLGERNLPITGFGT